MAQRYYLLFQKGLRNMKKMIQGVKEQPESELEKKTTQK